MEESEGGDFPPKKAQSEPAATEASAHVVTDYPAKKLARQLDFTGFGGAAAVALPEQAKQTQQQVMKSGQLSVSMKSTQMTRPQLQTQTQALPQSQQHHILLMPMQQTRVLPPHPSIRPVKPESPKARSRQSANEAKDGTPKKPKQCNCKHSRCLKLAIVRDLSQRINSSDSGKRNQSPEVFFWRLFQGCLRLLYLCQCCAKSNTTTRVVTVRRPNPSENLRQQPPHAPPRATRSSRADAYDHFRPFFEKFPSEQLGCLEEAGDGLVLPKHNKGCHCKKSGCLKKYCECFQANILCSENCKCMDCKNFEGSQERQALFHGDHANNMAYLQQAANAAITGAIGSSGYGSPPVNKKRKAQELFFGSMIKDPVHRLGQLQQESQIKASVPPSPLSSIPGPRVGNAAALGPSKFTYRSLLADLIHPHDIKELCSVLVDYAWEAGRMLAETKCSSMVRGADSGSQNEVNGNGIAMTDSRNQHEPFRNGVANTVPTPPPPPPPPQKVEPGTTAFNNNPCPKVHPPDGNGDVKSKICNKL
nr:protein tesmin/TSO1-like CXC 5 isoform X4 [Nicotiana tomentosiformis]